MPVEFESLKKYGVFAVTAFMATTALAKSLVQLFRKFLTSIGPKK